MGEYRGTAIGSHSLDPIPIRPFRRQKLPYRASGLGSSQLLAGLEGPHFRPESKGVRSLL